MPSSNAALRLLADVEALILPRICLGCERPLRREEDVCCAACRWAMKKIGPPKCERCGQPLDRWEQNKADRRTANQEKATCVADRLTALSCCGFCRSWPEQLAWATSAVWLEPGPARELAHALKYNGWTCAARPMADIIARECSLRLSQIDVLVPIPLGRTRMRERGHNQAEDLARALGKTLGKSVAPHALVRRRDTRTQTELSRTERWANVAGAFACDDAGIRGMRVALVDDVLTTGATLAAAALALSNGGANDVGAVTFARAVQPV